MEDAVLASHCVPAVTREDTIEDVCFVCSAITLTSTTLASFVLKHHEYSSLHGGMASKQKSDSSALTRITTTAVYPLYLIFNDPWTTFLHLSKYAFAELTREISASAAI